MSKFTFLTKEQCFGDDKLDVIKKRGEKAAITDFAILSRGDVTNEYIDDDCSLSGRTGCYWTKSGDNGIAVAVDHWGEYTMTRVDYPCYGARPAIPSSIIPKTSTNVVRDRVFNGVREVEYGFYPRSAVHKMKQDELNQQLNAGKVKETGNSYTTGSDAVVDGHYARFQPQKHKEYQYKGKRYVRVKANHSVDSLSNGEGYKFGDYVWVEVEPVKWLVDERAKIMITKDIIFAGVPFNHERYKTKNFGTTDIKKFMDKYLEKELFQQRNIGVQNSGNATSKRKSKRNPYGFDFGEATEKDIIESAIRSNVSIFLHGKPGCGKSDRVKQLDPDFIELNLSHLDPELLDGLAGEKDGKAIHIKPPWLEELEKKCEEEPDKIHILFLEELTNASPMMQSKAYGIALDKKVAGRWKLPEQARVVAAGNELEDSLVANEIAEPLYDRFAHVNIEETVEGWLEWATTPEVSYKRLDYEKQDTSRPKIHPAIYAFIRYKGDEVLRTPYNREYPEPHADPRRWKMASDMLYATNKPWTLQAIIGEDLTRDFIAFCQTHTLSVQDVIKGNYSSQDFKDFDLGKQLALVTSMLAVDSENMPKVRAFLKKHVPKEILATFASQWVHGDAARAEQMQEVMLEETEKEAKKKQTAKEKQTIKESHKADEEQTTGKSHTAKETIFTRIKGILNYEQVDTEYNESLSIQRKRR